jgi:UDP-GlcNAc3NAcA epimerase
MPINVITVLGALPQFVKAPALSRALAAAGAAEKIIHTGQHYDAGMSGNFFSELGIPEPRWDLGCGGSTQGAMTGAMLQGIERILMDERPDIVVVYGDTNSTLAGALAAAKLHIPVAHVEAGLRSFNRRMPEELNRICTDHLADLNFCSSAAGCEVLAKEGITRGVHLTGDIMADVPFAALAKAGPFSLPGVPHGSRWALLTLHRQENTGSPKNLRNNFEALSGWNAPVCFPLHPRTRRRSDRIFCQGVAPMERRFCQAEFHTATIWLTKRTRDDRMRRRAVRQIPSLQGEREPAGKVPGSGRRFPSFAFTASPRMPWNDV